MKNDKSEMENQLPATYAELIPLPTRYREVVLTPFTLRLSSGSVVEMANEK